jgi:hypothetical protein
MMLYRGILLVAMLVLGACGGGDSSGGGGTTTVGTTGGTTSGGTTGGVIPGGFDLDTGIGGSGGIIGDIDEFGSIVMNGLTLDTDDAEFYIEGESVVVGQAGQDGLREGQYIIVAGDVSASVAEEVVYRANLKGPVSAVTASDPLAGIYELTVLRQTVITSASTRFDGVIAENIMVSDLLEVSGPIDEQGRVLATYVGLKASLADFKAIGRVASLDTTSETFDLGGLLVDYSGASLSEFEGASLAEGQLVEVRVASALYAATGSVPVDEVELLPEAQLSEGAEIEIEGVIDSFVSATDFTVGGLAVTTDGNTAYENGTVGQLAAGVRVEVEGTADAQGVIVAEEVEFEDDPAIRVEGAVTAVDVTAATVTAMGLTFEIRASTELEDDRDSLEPFTLDDLMIGDYIEVRGYLDGGAIVGVELEREDDPNLGEYRARLRGPLTAFDESAGTVEIQGVTVNELDVTTEYEDADEQTVTRTAFFNLLPATLSAGAEVTADWDDFSPSNAAPSDAGPADTLSLEDDD